MAQLQRRDALLQRLTAAGPATAEGGVRDAEARLRCKDGAVKWVRVDANVLRDEGEFVHVRTFVRDVTARKAADGDGCFGTKRSARIRCAGCSTATPRT